MNVLPAQSFKITRTSSLALLLGVSVLAPAYSQTAWEPENQNWADPDNWSDGVPDVQAENPNHFTIVDITDGNFPIIETDDYFFGAPTTSNFQSSFVGAFGSTTARLDIRSGSLSRDPSSGQLGNFGVAANGAGPVLNIADTTITGQSNFSTFGQGSGSLSVRNFTIGIFGANSEGTVNINTTGLVSATQSIEVGAAGTGTLNLSGGTVSSSNFVGGLVLGRDSGATGTVNMDGGRIGDGDTAVHNFIRIGRSGTGTFNQTGGVIDFQDQFNSAIEIGELEGSTGVFNMSGGTASMQRITVGMEGSGTLNLSGTAELTANQFGRLTIVGERLDNDGTVVVAASGSGVVNLDGGILTVNQIQTMADDASLSESVFNFNGGILRAFSGSQGATFMEGLTEANILSGGAFIDTNGFNITIAQALHGDGDLTKLGGGTLTLSSASNSFTGGLNVEGGILSIGIPFLDESAVVTLVATSLLDLNFTGDMTISGLIFDGVDQGIGTFDSGNTSFLTGAGSLTVIPEPSTGMLLIGTALWTLMFHRRRRS